MWSIIFWNHGRLPAITRSTPCATDPTIYAHIDGPEKPCMDVKHLDLEATRPPATTSPLELATLAGNIGFLEKLVLACGQPAEKCVPCGSGDRNRNA